jgi:CRISPR-associated endonuclease/helicase Cas3
LKNGDVWSHPNKPLENHLIGTVRIADEIAKNCGLTLNNNEKNAILLHDIAKAHPSFQKRLRTGRGKFGHAVLSSALVLGLTHDLLCTEAVRRHHGSLQNIPSDVWKFWNEWEWDEDKQRLVSNLSWWPGADVISKMIQMRISSWMELIPSQNDWEDIIISSVDNYGQDPFEEGSTGWLRLRLLYSLLVAADRIEATSGQLFSSKKPTLNYKRFEEHLRGLAQGKLAAWRNKVRQMVIENARLLINKPGVYTLTLPTGAGKTLIGLQIALEAAERLSAVRILYILPYVSLVEQNAGIAAKVFDGVREDHHLAYGKSTHLEEKQDEYTLDDFMSFFRYWHEPVIVTTLAKLWEVLYSPRANDAMSFHSLSNAIVVLD